MRTLILGSGLSRETNGWLGTYGFETTAASLGQSLIALRGAIPGLEEHANLSGLATRSQRRTLLGTLRGDFVAQLEAQRHTTDLLLWDLGHELLGVYEYADGFVTRTPELVHSGLDSALARSARHIAFGTDEHFRLWRLALDEWHAKVTALGLSGRTVLLAPRWPRQFDDGSTVGPVANFSPDDLDTVTWHYLQAAQHTVDGLHVVGTDVLAIAQRGRSGEASVFALADVTSHALAEGVNALVNDEESPVPPPLPRVERVGANDFVVHAAADHASREFALYVTSRDGVHEKFSYQESPTFHVRVTDPGTYRFRLFYKRPHDKVAVYSAPVRVDSGA